MKKTLICTLIAAVVLSSSIAQATNQPVWVNSKEYKVLLDPSRFASNPQSAASSLLQDLGTRLNQLGFDKTVSGSFKAGDSDQVAYYDTPGSCLFQNNGYSLRTRQGADNDVQFKFRHADEELSAFTDVSGAGKNVSSKLETDISPNNLVYSNSTNQDPAANGAPTTVSAVIAQFPGASVFSSAGSQSVVAVNGLNIRQQEYTGPSSDIGASKAKFTLSLWYVGNNSAPDLVELSFKVKADDSSYFTTPVLQRSQTLMRAISTLNSWTQSPSSNKTAWVYNYRSSSYPNGFCSTGG